MKNLIIACSLLFATASFTNSTEVSAQVNSQKVYVQGYYKSNGTYVKGHYKTKANGTNRDNYSTKPNYNPYTGKKGYIKPDNKRRSSYWYE